MSALGTTPHGDAPQVSAPRYHFLGTWVDGFTVESFIDAVATWSRDQRQHVVANHNVNSLVLLQRDPEFARFYQQVDAMFVDGVAVMLLARLLGARVERKHRIAVLDWIWPLLERAEQEGWSVVHVGGAPDVLATATRKIRARHPDLEFRAVSGFFDMARASENDAVLQQVQQARPTVVLVGMGMPRQEAWLLQNLDRLPACVLVTVGGILSFIGDERPTPPRWTGTLGVEWLFRLVTEPRRLWRRYLVEPLALVPVVSRELLARAGRSGRRALGSRGR